MFWPMMEKLLKIGFFSPNIIGKFGCSLDILGKPSGKRI
jgi:hypothetical protein